MILTTKLLTVFLLCLSVTVTTETKTLCADFVQCLGGHSFDVCYARFQGASCSNAECEYGDWAAWSLCSVSCGSGRQQQRRRATNSNNGAPCNVTRTARVCNAQTCPIGLETTTPCLQQPCTSLNTPSHCQMINRPSNQQLCPITKQPPAIRKMWYFDSFGDECRQFELFSCDQQLYGVHNAYATAHACGVYCQQHLRGDHQAAYDVENEPPAPSTTSPLTAIPVKSVDNKEEPVVGIRSYRRSTVRPRLMTSSRSDIRSNAALPSSAHNFTKNYTDPKPEISNETLSTQNIQLPARQKIVRSGHEISAIDTSLDQHCTELGRGPACDAAEAAIMYYYDNTLDECLAFAYCHSEQNEQFLNRYETLVQCSKRCQLDEARLCYGNQIPQLGLGGTALRCDGQCGDGFVCTQESNGVCCPAYNQEYFARSYNPSCKAGSQLIWRQNAPLLGRSCADHFCPSQSECSQGFRLFAFCCSFRHFPTENPILTQSAVRRNPPAQIRPWCRQLLPESSTANSSTTRHNFYLTARGRWIADLHCRDWCRLSKGDASNGCCDLDQWKCRCGQRNCVD